MEEARGDTGSAQQPLFKGLAADEKDLGITEIESLCMKCEGNVSSNSTGTCTLYVKLF